MAKKKVKKKSDKPKDADQKLKLNGTFDEVLIATLPIEEQKKLKKDK